MEDTLKDAEILARRCKNTSLAHAIISVVLLIAFTFGVSRNWNETVKNDPKMIGKVGILWLVLAVSIALCFVSWDASKKAEDDLEEQNAANQAAPEQGAPADDPAPTA